MTSTSTPVLACVRTRALFGLQALRCEVQVHLANGLPGFQLVGLPQTEVRESRERVRAALLANGFDFPMRRITVNLAPADLPKGSGHFDLPIALGILAASGQIPMHRLSKIEAVGELALDGALSAARGAVAMAWALCKEAQDSFLMLPDANASQAAKIRAAKLLPVATLAQAVRFLKSGQLDPLPVAQDSPQPASSVEPPPDFSQIQGLADARRMAEIAAAGGHSMLLVGPPGCGKSMLAARMSTILPPLPDEEAAECAALQSLVSRGAPRPWGERPFRSPHHHASAHALVGGGHPPQPGEISLAHHGVLFLDELPEFSRSGLEALREPLETGQICLARAQHKLTYPARFQLVAAMNPCPCGYLGVRPVRCHCAAEQISRYQRRISGPLLDRIDLRLQLCAAPAADMLSGPPAESSSEIRKRVCEARYRQIERQGCANAHTQTTMAQWHAQCAPEAIALLEQAAKTWSFSSRALTRVIRIARTIADLAGCTTLTRPCVAEALRYRFEPGRA